jgi:hypothetical protein
MLHEPSCRHVVERTGPKLRPLTLAFKLGYAIDNQMSLISGMLMFAAVNSFRRANEQFVA